MSEQNKVVDDVKVINGVTVDVDDRDDSGYISKAHGATTPTAASAGFATGCEFTNTTSDTVYVNEGDEASCDFQVLVAGEVTAADLGTDSVNSDEIAANAVGASELADNAVDQAAMADNAVGNAEMADNAIGNAEMADNAVGTAEVQDGTLTANDLHNDARKNVETASLSALPAPTGANQLANALFAFKAPMNARIDSVELVSDTATAGSDAASHYEASVYNATTAQSLTTVKSSTVGNEIAVETPWTITVNQNQDINNDAVLQIIVDIYDDGAPNPTDLSAAEIRAVIAWSLRA